jgi:hypothetical protein
MPTILALFPGGYDLLIIMVIVLVLFGEGLPTIMSSLGDGFRCPRCGWRSFSPYYCVHCGRRKLPLSFSVSPPDKKAILGHGQMRIHLPRWLLCILIIAGAAWAADWIGSSAAGLSSDFTWRSWWHWATMALVFAALISLVVTAIVAHFGRQKET